METTFFIYLALYIGSEKENQKCHSSSVIYVYALLDKLKVLRPKTTSSWRSTESLLTQIQKIPGDLYYWNCTDPPKQLLKFQHIPNQKYN